MKTKIILSVSALLVMAFSMGSFAQKSDKQLSKELKAKANKECRKEAKNLKKAGWSVMPGKLTIDKQIQQGRFTELNEDAHGVKLYFTGTNTAIGGNYSTAKQIADSRARLELARQINSLVKEKIQDKLASNDYGDGDIETINEFFSANEATIIARLQGIIPIVELYRQLPKNQVEVKVMVGILREDAFKSIRRALKENLNEKTTKLLDELDA